MRIDQPDPDASDTPRASDRETPRETESSADETRHSTEVSANRTEQIAEHYRYQEIAASYQEHPGASNHPADDRTAWDDAVPELRATWEEHKERYPEQARAIPRTEPDGSWVCGEHRRLDPEQNTEVSKAHADLADEADRHILPALRRVEAADPERQLAGLEHMIKGEDRLKEKLADELFGKEKTVRQALSEVPDAVRFTFRYGFERYAEGVLVDVAQLKAEGFELIKLKNLWTDSQYKGINSQWRRQETGARFEMQFHTRESLEAKELTHEAYERIRAPEVTPAERREARGFQRQVIALLHAPPGTNRIENYPEKTDD
jgi:hypothetical protein